MTIWEIALVLGVALIVIKPERLPEIALALGRFLRILKNRLSKRSH